jgi:hypothetical protein
MFFMLLEDQQQSIDEKGMGKSFTGSKGEEDGGEKEERHS